MKATLKLTISLIMFILSVGGFAMESYLVGGMFVLMGVVMLPPMYSAIKHIVKKRSIIAVFMAVTFIIALVLTPSSKDLEKKKKEEDKPLNDVTISGSTIDSELKISFIDVGQGDSVLLSCDGHYALYDTGYYEYKDDLIIYLKSQGVEKLDYLIISHLDSDHVGSAPAICDSFTVDNLIITTDTTNVTNITPFELLMEAKDKYNINHIEPTEDTSYNLGKTTLNVLVPKKKYEEINNNSICVLVTHYEDTILLTGDAETEQETDLVNTYGSSIDVDLLKAGHHGSSSSNTDAILDTTTPDAIIISCGLDNDYGHPTQRVINDIKERNIACYRTDEQGTIECISSGSGFSFSVSPSTTWTVGEYKLP